MHKQKEHETRMKKVAIIIILILTTGLSYSQTKDSSYYFGINIAPIISTQFSIFIERQIHANLTFNIGAGYVFDGPGSFIKLGTEKKLDKSSGGFLSFGINGHLKNRIISPIIGLKFVNALSYEKGEKLDLITNNPPEPFESNGYSLGIGGLIGLTFKISKKIACDLAAQGSLLLINGLCDFHSFAPGMGINWNPMRGQYIAQIKYQL